jgi:hypothetical protein
MLQELRTLLCNSKRYLYTPRSGSLGLRSRIVCIFSLVRIPEKPSYLEVFVIIVASPLINQGNFRVFLLTTLPESLFQGL